MILNEDMDRFKYQDTLLETNKSKFLVENSKLITYIEGNQTLLTRCPNRNIVRYVHWREKKQLSVH